LSAFFQSGRKKKYSEDMNGQKRVEDSLLSDLLLDLTAAASIDFDTGVNLNEFIETSQDTSTGDTS